MAYTNVHRMARISPQKARLVVGLIRGKRYADALNTLELSKLRAAVLVKNALVAAYHNADQAEANVRNLIVSDARVDAGPTIKRFQPKDRGRSHKILKRTSHISVSVDEA